MANRMVIIFIDLDDTLILQEKTRIESGGIVNLKGQMIKIIKKYNFPDSSIDKLNTFDRASLLWNAIMDQLYELKKSDNEISTIRNDLDEVIAKHEREDHEKSFLSEETIPFLEQLRKEGYTLIMLTNTSRFELDKIFSKYNLTKYFNGSITRDDVIKIKPDPEGIKKMLNKLGEDSFVIIDDLDYGIIAAKKSLNLGYRSYTILVDRRKYKKQKLKQLNPDAVVNSLKEIPELLKNLHRLMK